MEKIIGNSSAITTSSSSSSTIRILLCFSLPFFLLLFFVSLLLLPLSLSSPIFLFSANNSTFFLLRLFILSVSVFSSYFSGLALLVLALQLWVLSFFISSSRLGWKWDFRFIFTRQS